LISFFLILFLIELLLIINSNNATLFSQSLVLTKVCDCTQTKASQSLSATLSWISEGKNPINLLIVFDAEFVCNVLKTKCPVSANSKTAAAVSLSRISQINKISGSCLIAALKAFGKDQVSCHISL
jgi:hypothetical protein